MKKFLALVLSLCLVLSLAACGGKPADDDTAEGSKTGGHHTGGPEQCSREHEYLVPE